MMEDNDPEVATARAERGMATCLFEASLLIVSCALFYKFAWLYYRERLFPHHSFATAAATATVSSRGGGVLSLKATGRAFALTFALSCCIFELIILEIAGLLNPASSPLAWRVCLSLMVLALHAILPFLFAFACLGEMGLGRRSAGVGALILLSGVLFVASDLGHQDVPGAAPAQQGRPPIFSLEAGLARVGVVGVASLALLSGFGAVNLPYQQLATLLRTVPPSLVKSRERRAMLTLKDIGQRKRRAAMMISSSRSSTMRDNGNGHGSGGWGVSAASEHADYGDALSSGFARGGGWGTSARQGGVVSRTVRAWAAMVPSFSRSAVGSGGSSSVSTFAQAAAEAEATTRLEQIAQELFLEISDCRRIQEQQQRARTLPGRVLVGFGAAMFLYCLLRLWKAGVSVWWTATAAGHPSPVGTTIISTGDVDIGGATDGGGLPGGEGTGDDPATRLVRFALSRHLLGDIDAEGWSELVSFVLIGVLVFMQTRGFLATITTVSRASFMSGFSIPPQVLSLFLSQLMGTYFTSSVILMRVNLPPRHRVAITAVLGGMRFSFYQRWFDTVFLLSGCATAVTLLAFHLANRNSDADHREEDHYNARSEASAASITATYTNNVGEAFWRKGDGRERGGRNNRAAVPGLGVAGPDQLVQGYESSRSSGGHGYFGLGNYTKGSGSAGIRPRGRGAAGGLSSHLDRSNRNVWFGSSISAGGGGEISSRAARETAPTSVGRRSSVKEF